MTTRKVRAPDAAGSRRRDTFMEIETAALLAAARRAQLFEHNTNRGNEAEEAIRRWLRAWLEPEYTISSGEIIDSVEPAGAPVARQQDGIVHVNSLHGRRYTLPSGMRLVPIETVVATVEVKLTLTKEEFESADTAAAELLDKQLALRSREVLDGKEWIGDVTHFLPLHRVRDRVTMALIGYFGPTETEKLAAWLRNARAIELVCCLEGGCVLRSNDASQPGMYIYPTAKALAGFVDSLRSGIASFKFEGEESVADEWAYAHEPPFVPDAHD